ncbi:protein D3-like [Oratosquilla oratoria]|uniref:protein D3-like n=1 Tax=Oratosquilla oratoria TaxID=337810 RepID=UPI003F7597EF
MHTFFEPLVEVEAEELSDDEWHQYLEEEWQANGIVPDLLASPPPNVANLDFGDHNCVHLGNLLLPAQTRHPPKRIDFPGLEGLEYAILLLDLDTKVKGHGKNLNWMKVNVPFDRPHKGTEVVAYEGPRPSQTSGRHRYALLVYLQKEHIDPGSTPGLPRADVCQAEPRTVGDLEDLTRRLGLRGPVAGNYFQASWDVTVEHACTQEPPPPPTQ